MPKFNERHGYKHPRISTPRKMNSKGNHTKTHYNQNFQKKQKES